MSLIGRINGYKLVPVVNLLLNTPNYMSADDLISMYEADSYYSLKVARIIAIVFISLMVAIIATYCISRAIYMKNNGQEAIRDYAWKNHALYIYDISI